jgi:hypothetical protein
MEMNANALKFTLPILSAIMLAFSAGAKNKSDVVSFYVSPDGSDTAEGTLKKPLKSPHRALELVRKVFSDAKREIVFLDGFYRLDKPLELNADDAGVSLRAQNKGKAIISGAAQVMNWRKDLKDPSLLAADLPFETEQNLLYLLVVNGRHATLATYPKGINIVCPATEGDKTNFLSLPYEPSSFPEGFDISSLDISSVWLSIPQEWAVTKSFIAKNDVRNNRFVLKTKTNMAIGMFNTGFKLMNSRLGLIDPGSWMYEKSSSTIVYKPRPGESEKNINAWISRLPTLIDLRRVHDCTIDGLVMEGCLEMFSNPLYSTNALSAVVSSQFGSHLTVRNCEIRSSRSGGVYMLKANRCRIENNYIHDISATGISFIDGGPGYCKANSNKIRNMNCGISMQVGHIECMWNDIGEIGRSALQLWSSFSVVASNKLGNCMLTSRDGGALYGSYDYCLIKDNTVKYTKKSIWPGLYADEGSQYDVFTGNRTEGLAWPTHMHQTYGIVVSNNTFRSDVPMRWSFQGGMFSTFTDNKIYAPKPIKNDAYLNNCVEWARNKVFVKDAQTGRYALKNTLTLERKKSVPRDSLLVPYNEAASSGTSRIDGKRGNGEYPISWRKFVWTDVGADGYPCPGSQPGNVFCYSHDERYLYVHVSYVYSKCVPYVGQRNPGGRLGVDDSITLYFGEKISLVLFWDGTHSIKGTEHMFMEGDFKVDPGSWWSGSGMEVRIPLSVLGLEKSEFDSSVSFNCESYNADHKLKRYVYPVENGKVCTGKLVFPLDRIKEIR